MGRVCPQQACKHLIPLSGLPPISFSTRPVLGCLDAQAEKQQTPSILRRSLLEETPPLFHDPLFYATYSCYTIT